MLGLRIFSGDIVPCDFSNARGSDYAMGHVSMNMFMVPVSEKSVWPTMTVIRK